MQRCVNCRREFNEALGHCPYCGYRIGAQAESKNHLSPIVQAPPKKPAAPHPRVRTKSLFILAAAGVIILAAVAVAFRIRDMHKQNDRATEPNGFVTLETAEQTAMLGSFADFQTHSDPTAKDGTTAGTTGIGADYAYAYAGFQPQPADMNISEWNLLLVNRNYILPQGYAPALAEAAKGTGVQMDARVAPYYQAMYDAAKKDGITLTPLSGHRRISTQQTNFENKIKLYMDQGYDRAEATRKAATIILPPGTSEHNAGLAMDIISLDVDFEETKAFAWLQEHAQDYGFILRYPKDKESITEITYEPWHWRYVGVTHAKAIKQSGQTLEEYLGVR